MIIVVGNFTISVFRLPGIITCMGKEAREKYTSIYQIFVDISHMIYTLTIFFDNNLGGSHYGRMNGETPNVPITTLAGIASLTDRKYFEFHVY